jgi:LacI family transcriptional regulator
MDVSMAGSSTGTNSKSTIFDVAALSGVSIKTVSRVVNNEPNVREKTREKVQAAIAKLKYQPNAAARGLSGKRSFTIGLIYENPHEFSYVGAVLNGALHACEEEGYSLVLRPLTLPDPDLIQRVRAFVSQARLDGIVLPPPLADDAALLKELARLKIPCATLSPREAIEGTVSVMCEEEQASYELTNYVIEQGHELIGFIKGHPDHSATAKRLAGYRRALKDHGLEYSARRVKQGYFDFDSGKKCAAALLELEPSPTVVIASNDDMAAGVIFEAQERGLTVPQDLSVVGFDDTPLASHIWPTLTTVRQPIEQMADTATRMLITALRGNDDMPASASYQCEVVKRNSTTTLKS